MQQQDRVAPIHRSGHWSAPILLAAHCLLVSFVFTPPAQSESSFFVTIKNASRDGHAEECLTMGSSGQSMYPVRDTSGLGPAACANYRSLARQRERFWKLVPLGDDLYLIVNASRGFDECLVMGNFGLDQHPSRQSWGHGDYCGFPGGKDHIRGYAPAVWRLQQLEGQRYMITNTSLAGVEQCLAFLDDGQATYPQRWTWGSGDFCGHPGGKEGLLTDQQAVWTLDPDGLDYAPFEIPQAWLDGFVLFEHSLYSNLRLRPTGGSSNRVQAVWGGDRVYRWKIEPSGDGNYFYLANAEDPSRRLHVGHDGNGELYAEWGDDSAYKWGLRKLDTDPHSEGQFFLANKKYPDQWLIGPSEGSGRPRASGLGSSLHVWRIYLAPWIDASAPEYLGVTHWSLFRLDSRKFPGQRLYVQYGSDNRVFTGSGDGLPFMWWAEQLQGTDIYLRSNLGDKVGPLKRLHVGHDGNQELYAEWWDDQAYMWTVQPVLGTQYLTFRNRMHGSQRLKIDDHGGDHPTAGTGHGHQYHWKMLFYDGTS